MKPYYANSLRAFLGTEVRQDVNLGDFFLQPSARVGYRFDFLNDPTKLHAAFADIDSNDFRQRSRAHPLPFRAPIPAVATLVGGLNLNATTDNWTIGLSATISCAVRTTRPNRSARSRCSDESSASVLIER